MKRYSQAAAHQPQFINLKSTQNLSPSLMSSLLSPRITFKSKRTTTGPIQHRGQTGGGYFDSFKSLVGISSLVEQTPGEDLVVPPLDSDLGLGPSKSSLQTASIHSYWQSSSHPDTQTGQSSGLSSGGSLPNDHPISISVNGVRYPFAHSHRLSGRSKAPKPVIPGMITTCGPLPISSKFLGPRQVPSVDQTSNPKRLSHSTSGRVEEGSSTSGPSDPSINPNEATPTQATTNSSLGTTPNTHETSGTSPSVITPARKSGFESTGSLGRIQKKLLMERDRPISPTFFEDSVTHNHHQDPREELDAGKEFVNGVGGGMSRVRTTSSGTTDPPIGPINSGSTLPPPSYLIRSLGGQTGPLPFIPINLIPNSQPAQQRSRSLVKMTEMSIGPMVDPNSSSRSTKDVRRLTTGPEIHHPSRDGPHHPGPPNVKAGIEQSDKEVGSSTIEDGRRRLSSEMMFHPGRLNEPALKAKQAQSIKIWRNSLIDEVEQVLTDHESNVRFRNPLLESLTRVVARSRS